MQDAVLNTLCALSDGLLTVPQHDMSFGDFCLTDKETKACTNQSKVTQLVSVARIPMHSVWLLRMCFKYHIKSYHLLPADLQG